MSWFKRIVPGTALLFAAALTLACGQKPSEIRLKGTNLKVYGLGRVVSVGGDVVDRKGEIVPGKAVTWSTSNPKVATVDAQTGSVKTVGEGKAKIIARLDDPPLEAAVAIQVLDVALVNVFPSRTTVAGPAGSTFPLTLQVKNGAGKEIDMPAVWTSSAPAVATVDASGVVTSVGEGHVNVKAAVGDVSGAADLVVVFRTIETLEASPLTIPLKVGETGTVTLLARDPQGAPIPDVAATWTSSDPMVATCSGGTILAMGPGSTTIRAVCGARSAEVSVIVF